ncbi:MAG: hypothetical protein KatS3mg002_0008 [Candidatus Woesearchaeota archaeon]|nr:MAG: hypothetical protein KatS3mg002_0008 [Candidatus Woesearchaeota archaeon]
MKEEDTFNIESILDKELDIIYDSLIIEKNNLEPKDIPEYTIILPYTSDSKNIYIYGFKTVELNKESNNKNNDDDNNILKIIFNITPRYLMHLEKISVYIPYNNNFIEQVSDLKRYFSKIKEYKERD